MPSSDTHEGDARGLTFAPGIQPDVRAFRDLLHDVAGRLSGLGMALDVARHGDQPHDPALEVAWQAVNDLRHLVGEIGLLARFFSRHGPLVCGATEVRGLLDQAAAESGTPATVVVAHGLAGQSLSGDRAVLVQTFASIARSYARVPRGRVTISASAAEGFVEVRLLLEHAAADGSGDESADASPRPCYATSAVLDDFFQCVAEGHGGYFRRLPTSGAHAAIFAIPRA